jgi:hypothetical protein
MTTIPSLTESSSRDYLARDYDSLLAAMRALIPEQYSTWTDYRNEADLGNVLLELLAHWGDVFSYYTDRLANESFLGTAQTRQSIIQHLRLVGYSLATATPATTQLTLTFPTNCQQDIAITKGTAFATLSQDEQSAIRFEYLGENISCQNKQYLRFSVTEGRSIHDEVLGIATDAPNQRFCLGHRGLILHPGRSDDIVLTVNQIPWTLRTSLAFSRNQQTDFIIEIDEDDLATIIFGNGNFGAIPPQNAVIQASYRVGGGTYGNVAANTIQTILVQPDLTKLGAKVTNPRAATGGTQRESNTTAILRTPAQFQQQQRAVAAIDYQTLAQNFPGVGKVKAAATTWNTVTLYVALTNGVPMSDVLKANLLAYFEDQRLVTTTIEIAEVDYVKIYITAEIGIKTYYDPLKVKAQVQQVVGQLLVFNNVDFGQTLYLSKFYEAIEATEGVNYVTITEFRRELPGNALNFTSTLTTDDNKKIITTRFEIQAELPATSALITTSPLIQGCSWKISNEIPTNLTAITIRASAEITIKAEIDPEEVHNQIRARVQQLPILTPPLDVDQLNHYLQPFYQDIQALAGVEALNQLALAYPPRWSPIATNGKIELAEYEIPKIPNTSYDYNCYQSGINVIILEDI